jgi:hypothetical protein
MLRDDTSKLKFYSMGIVTVTKPRNTSIITVWPGEQFNLTDGPISKDITIRAISLPNADGKIHSSGTTSTKTIQASWIPLSDSNRMTAPDVVMNETVMLYRYADTNEYYWTTIFVEPSIRRLEIVTYAYGDLRTPLQQWDENSSYWITWDTVNKKVHLHTSKSDGEPYTYDVIIDTKIGKVTVQDDIKNSIELDSAKSTLTVNTNKEVIVNTQLAEVNATTSATITTKTATVNASSVLQVNSPNSNFSGNITAKGNINSGGNIAAKGTIIGSSESIPGTN